MIAKIISGGQTGVDRAALDVAMAMDVPHGGWVPRGRKAEDGTIPVRYNVRETPTDKYEDRTELNVLDSDGTLIISCGILTGGSALTRDLATRYAQPWLHLDLSATGIFASARRAHVWIRKHVIRILNVAGPRESADPGIYDKAKKVLQTLLYLDVVASQMPGSIGLTTDSPSNVKEAVACLASGLSLRDRMEIAGLAEERLVLLESSLGRVIRGQLRLGPENPQLMESCRRAMGKEEIDERAALNFIIKELWQELRKTHNLRIVK